MALLAALKHRPFALLWTGQSVSQLGDALYQIALAWWVLQRTGSAAVMGTVFVCSFTPLLLFLLIGGALGDRLHRLRLMCASDVARGLLVGLVAALAIAQRLEVWQVLAASVAFGLVSAFFRPAASATVPAIVPRALLSSANSLNALSAELVSIVGPGLGALVVARGGTGLAFALDSLSFFVSALALSPLLGLPERHARRADKVGIWRDMRAGLATAVASPLLWVNILAGSIYTLTNGAPYNVTLPFSVGETLHAGPAVLGLLYGASSLGSVLAAFGVGSAATFRHRGLLVFGGWAAAGLARAMVGLTTSLAVILAAMTLAGAFITFGELIWQRVVQETVVPDELGRVSSIDLLGSWSMLPIGYGLVGLATARLGPQLVLVISGTLTAIVCSAALSHPEIRGYD